MQPAVLHRRLLQRGDLRTLSSVTVLAESVRLQPCTVLFYWGGGAYMLIVISFSIVKHLLTNCFSELCENVQRYEVILRDPAAVWE